jgi:trehalose 6-phosphate phosphatase
MECVPRFAADWCFFLDLDGTLVDIAERPALVRIDASLHDLLRRLMALTGGAVALISGRSLVDIDRLFSPLRLPAAGQHGLERRDTSGAVHVFNAKPERLRQAANGLQRLVV